MCVATSPQLELSFEVQPLQGLVEVRSLGELGRLYDELRAAGVGQDEIAAIAKEAEISRRRGQFRVATVGDLTVTLRLPCGL